MLRQIIPGGSDFTVESNSVDEDGNLAGLNLHLASKTRRFQEIRTLKPAVISNSKLHGPGKFPNLPRALARLFIQIAKPECRVNFYVRDRRLPADYVPHRPVVCPST